MNIESQENIFKVTFDIQPLADRCGIDKQKCAELLADLIIEILGL